MRWKMYLLVLSIFLLKVEAAKAQQIITSAQQQAIEEIAIDRVKVFTRYLSLLAREREPVKVHMYKQYLTLSFIEPSSTNAGRVYNDLLPASVLERNPILDKHVFLKDYLQQIGLNYSNSLHLSYDHFRAHKIGYSEYLKQHFVIVTTQREMKGIFRSGSQLMENITESTIDFFVHLEVNPNGFNVGGIFGFEPHEERNKFTNIILIENPEPRKEGAKFSFREPIKAKASKRRVKLIRGNEHELKWSGGVKDDIIEVELIPMKGRKEKAYRFEPVRNLNSAIIFVSKDIKPGLYKFRITNITTGRYTQTGFIKIKRRYLLFGNNSSGEATYGSLVFLSPQEGHLFEDKLIITV